MKSLYIIISFSLAVASMSARAAEDVVLRCPSVSDVKVSNYSRYFTSVDDALPKVERFSFALLPKNIEEGDGFLCFYEFDTSEGPDYTMITSNELVFQCEPLSGPWELVMGSSPVTIECESSEPNNCKAVCKKH